MNIDPNLIVDALLAVLGDKLELSYLFGSYAAGRATEDSDIYLAILPQVIMTQEEVWQIAQKLAMQLEKDVDLINLMDCKTVLRMRVVQEGKLLFDPHRKAPCFETNVYRMYQDLQLSRHDSLASFKQQWAN